MSKHKIKISGLDVEVEVSVNQFGNLEIVPQIDLEEIFPDGITSSFYGEELVISEFKK